MTKHFKRPGFTALCSLLPALLGAAPAWAQAIDEADDGNDSELPAPELPDTGDNEDLQELLALPIEDLLTVESTSVAKKRQKVSDSAAAVYVISQQDIALSPARTLPELLRMAPGIEVAELQNGEIAVTARGFNSPLAGTLLVLIDGRAIYFSSLAGVLWSQQQLPLSEIERIEIVRGPGATLWGSNAVNGVVNIISKHSSASRGLTLDAQAGTREQRASLSYNGDLGDDLSYRLYGKVSRDRGLVDADGEDMTKASRSVAAGVRLDYEPDAQTAATLQYDVASGSYGEVTHVVRTDLATPGYDLTEFHNTYSSHSLLARLALQPSDGLELSAQGYINLNRVHLKGVDGRQTMIDLDLGAHWQIGAGHDLALGIGARTNATDIVSAPTFAFQSDHYRDTWISGYIQDEISLIDDRLTLTVGSKFEHNNFSGFEFQPSAKLLFKPSDALTVWGGVSRSARTPSIYERAADFHTAIYFPGDPHNPFPLPVYSNEQGNPDLRSEKSTALEFGLRGNLAEGWSFDLAAYHNSYKGLIAPRMVGADLLFPGMAPFTTTGFYPGAIEASVEFGNIDSARTWGVEALLSGKLAPWWRLDLTYAHLGVIEPAQLGTLGNSPRHQASVRSTMDFSDRTALQASWRYVGRLNAGMVPAYNELDLRLRQVLAPNLDVSLIGNNLLNAHHLEYHDPLIPTAKAQVARSVFVQIGARF